MSKKPILSISILLLASLTLHSKMLNSDCGYGYNTLEGIIKKSPFDRPKCDTRSIYTQKKTILTPITKLNDLFEYLEISKNKKFLENYFVQKIFNDPYINRYTITILYYEKQDLFEHYLQNKSVDNLLINKKIQIYGDSYIDKVINGGKHIILFHIETKSKKEYEKIRKKVMKKLYTYEAFQTYIQKLSKSNKIIVKEYFNKGLHAIPSDNIIDIFQQKSYFDNLIKEKAIPYRYVIRRYPVSTKNKSKNRFVYNLSRLTDIQYQLNNYRYYIHHIDQFKPLNNNKRLKLRYLVDIYTKTIFHTTKNIKTIMDNNISLKENIDQALPSRFEAYASNSNITISKKEISIAIKNFNYKIDANKTFTIEVESKLDIQNQAKLIRIETTMNFHDSKIKKQTKKTQILCDTYVNYPGLRFKNIYNNYGSLILEVPFEKYTQQFQIKGQGIIKSATCGYDLGTDKILHIFCKNIIYTPVEIELKHSE